jgi:hypothetical protein
LRVFELEGSSADSRPSLDRFLGRGFVFDCASTAAGSILLEGEVASMVSWGRVSKSSGSLSGGGFGGEDDSKGRLEEDILLSRKGRIKGFTLLQVRKSSMVFTTTLFAINMDAMMMRK